MLQGPFSGCGEQGSPSPWRSGFSLQWPLWLQSRLQGSLVAAAGSIRAAPASSPGSVFVASGLWSAGSVLGAPGLSSASSVRVAPASGAQAQSLWLPGSRAQAQSSGLPGSRAQAQSLRLPPLEPRLSPCGSRALERRLSRCGSRALERRLSLCGSRLWNPGSVLGAPGLWSAGSVLVLQGLSCSAVRGILPDQGPNPCLLHWQGDSLPLSHQESPCLAFGKMSCVLTLPGDLNIVHLTCTKIQQKLDLKKKQNTFLKQNYS